MPDPSRRIFLSQSLGIATWATATWTAPRMMATPNGAAQTSSAHCRNPQNHNAPHLHLLVDDRELDVVENLKRFVNRVHKHPQPVLVSDRPLEGERAQAWGSVIKEPDGPFRPRCRQPRDDPRNRRLCRPAC